MLHDWGVIAAAFGYIGLLFVVASYGERLTQLQRGRLGTIIYPLSLAIYCTSWTFFGSVGLATRTSVEFLAIYVGPILMILIVSLLAWNGFRAIVRDTSAALAAYATSCGIKTTIFCPADTPEVNVGEIELQGAKMPLKPPAQK